MSGDRGIAVKGVYTWNTQHGIATAIPWRRTKPHPDRGALEDEKVYRHGVPRCGHCGSEGKTKGRRLGFTITSHGTPVIRFRCIGKLTEDCRRIQSVRCDHEP